MSSKFLYSKQNSLIPYPLFKSEIMDSTQHNKSNQPEEKLPSSSSSPAHEFSFAISLHNNTNTAKSLILPPPQPFAIDLSPADDIFFHGHLLPLHLLSHLPVSPRSSTNSIDSFTLPIRDLLDDQISNQITPIHNFSTSNRILTGENHTNTSRIKPKSFSLFRWRKGCEDRDTEDGDNNNNNNNNKQKKKLRFEVSRVLKRYLRMVRPLLLFKGRRENLQFHRQPPYGSFSGNLGWRNKQEMRGRRGEFSAPASMRTSPTNSGLLVATATKPPCGSDSTMEELQAAIQAAIAHCKKSISADEKINC